MEIAVEGLTAAQTEATAARERTNDLLAQLAGNVGGVLNEMRAEPPRIGRRSEPTEVGMLMPIAHFQFLLEARVPIRKVPAHFYEQRGDLALVACGCRRAHRLIRDRAHDCLCGRIFLYTGKGMYAANPNDAPEPVVD